MSALRRIKAAAAKRVAGVRARVAKFRKKDDDEPVKLPASAALIAVQHPSATLPERSYDLLLIAAVFALLGVILLGETFSWHEPLGAVLVLLGILLAQGRLRMPRRRAIAAA